MSDIPVPASIDGLLAQLRLLGDALLDSWFVCDAERNIVDFNRTFHSMLPRAQARNLKGKKCYDVLKLDICKDRCIAEQCWREKKQIRLDEISGRPDGDQPRRYILSALPIFDDSGRRVGALEIQRDVTDQAQVQEKYKEMLEEEAAEREQLKTQIRARTRELLEANQSLRRTREELLQFKKGSAL